jgi:hypothetical protein
MLLFLRHFEKRPHHVLLGLDFPPLGAKVGAVLLEVGVGLLAHADGRPVLAFHLRFIRFITDKYLRVLALAEMNLDGYQHTTRRV